MRIGPILTLLVACSTSPDSKDTASPTAPSLDSPGPADADADADTDADTDSDADSDTPTSPPDTGALPCANPLVDQFPGDGQVDVYVGAEVSFTLEGVDLAATIEVTDPLGVVVPGTSTVDGTVVRWAGDRALETLTTYDATLTHTCGVETSQFVTSDVGVEPLAVDPTGLVYAIDLGSGVWAQPVGLGAVLASLLATQQLLLSPTAVDQSTVDFLAGIGVGNVQDTCIATVPMPQTSFTDPTFSLVAPLVQLDFGGTLVDVNDVDVVGSFAADAGRIQFGTLSAVIDTRYLGPAIGLSPAYDEVCNLVYYLGFSCDVCADGLPYCMAISVHDLEAPSVGGTLVPRTVGEIVADPSCP